jgi:hypothetical protein
MLQHFHGLNPRLPAQNRPASDNQARLMSLRLGDPKLVEAAVTEFSVRKDS